MRHMTSQMICQRFLCFLFCISRPLLYSSPQFSLHLRILPHRRLCLWDSARSAYQRHQLRMWPDKVLRQFATVPDKPSEGVYHAPYNKLLSTLFPPDAGLAVARFDFGVGAP